MANSSFIREAKNLILSQLQDDDEIVNCLGLNPSEDRDNLIYTRLFPHYYNPITETEVKTYIMMEVEIPEMKTRYLNGVNKNVIYPRITIGIICHQSDMRLQLPKTSAVRTDYIAELIVNKYNGKDLLGLKNLELVSDEAPPVNDTYRSRVLVFKGADFNDSYCG